MDQFYLRHIKIMENKLYRIQTDPNASLSPIATAYYQTSLTVSGQTFVSPTLTQVSWPLHTGKMVTYDGQEYPYYLASALVVAIADQELAEKLAQ